MAQRIKTGDNVAIISGSDKGRTGRVQRLVRDDAGHIDKLVIEGINRKTKHVKPSQTSPQGGRISVNAPVHVSNVMLVDPETGKPTRVKFETRDGVKHRVAVKSGTSLGPVTKAKKK